MTLLRALHVASLYSLHHIHSGPSSSAGIATGYELDGQGSNPGGGRDFPHLSSPVLGPTQPPVQPVPGVFPGVKSGRGVTLTPHPFYCCGQERVELYLYSPYGPYGLYREFSACTRVNFTFTIYISKPVE